VVFISSHFFYADTCLYEIKFKFQSHFFLFGRDKESLIYTYIDLVKLLCFHQYFILEEMANSF